MSEQDAASQNGSSDSSNDSLNGSWVKLDESFKSGSERPFSTHNGETEILLAEAVADTVGAQRHSSSSTPTNGRLVTVEACPEADTRVFPPENPTYDPSWIENWASRVESSPPKKWQLTYPPEKYREKNRKISMANGKTDAFQVDLYIVIPAILFTHIIAFGIGWYIGRRSSTSTAAV